MKKRLILAVNAVLVVGIIVFVGLYSRFESTRTYELRLGAFESATFAVGRLTENNIEAEQRVCDVWAKYISESGLTMEEAIDFIKTSQVLKHTSAHLIDAETLKGLSSKPSLSDENDFAVSYAGYNMFDDTDWIAPVGTTVNITRTFTNPMNGEQSLAFCNEVTLRGSDKDMQKALLLRVLPVEELETKLVFPHDQYADVEYAIIDTRGNYVLKGRSFKNNNFFEFYKSYNELDSQGADRLQNEVTSGVGSITMFDSQRVRCVLAHASITATTGWALLAMLPAAELYTGLENWMLLVVVAGGLSVLFVFDLVCMMYLNRQLRQMAAAAEAANKAKTDFLSTMSHDIRTPMNAIVGLTTLTERNLDDRAAVAENLRKIALANEHLLNLINDILDISKVESGKVTLSPVTVSVTETIDNLVNLAQPMVREKNLDFSFSVNRLEWEYLFVDQVRLNQVFVNILSNACKYTEPGGSVAVSMMETATETEGAVRLTYIVADTGMGMSEEFMETMYQPFSRQADSRVNSIQGTGLGLAITHQMVGLMGGTIRCESQLGVGTTFTIDIEIPVSDHKGVDMHLDPIDVLVVDDDAPTLETAADTLRSLGTAVEVASSGEGAVEAVRRRLDAGTGFDVAIIDWKMPGMDGIECVRQLRSMLPFSECILLIAAYEWSDFESCALEAGADGFIGKPLLRSRLYERISEAMGKAAESGEAEDDFADLEGMRVLVAEDNDMNWEIASAMLEMYGVESERAENGRACVEMMEAPGSDRFALIFMDVQMPQMNGLDATRAIRALDDPKASSIPIIAMTADAFSENVAACLDAGMDGHIAKPIDMNMVIKEIRGVKERGAR